MSKPLPPSLPSFRNDPEWRGANASMARLDRKWRETDLRLEILRHEETVESLKWSPSTSAERQANIKARHAEMLEALNEHVRASNEADASDGVDDAIKNGTIPPEVAAGLTLVIWGLPELSGSREDRRNYLRKKQEILSEAYDIQKPIVAEIQGRFCREVALSLKPQYAKLLERHYRACEAVLNSLEDLREVQALWLNSDVGSWRYDILPHPIMTRTSMGDETTVRSDVRRLRIAYEEKGFI